ncbi:transglycosylase domain-containing protein, partial [Escherichia coli]|nr:transglycosylase domain-containing protein [Escherichia coli]
MDQISPWMGLAESGAEEHKFPEHWGFGCACLEQAPEHSGRNAKRIYVASTISPQTAQELFLWYGRSWVLKGLETGLWVGVETG